MKPYIKVPSKQIREFVSVKLGELKQQFEQDITAYEKEYQEKKQRWDTIVRRFREMYEFIYLDCEKRRSSLLNIFVDIRRPHLYVTNIFCSIDLDLRQYEKLEPLLKDKFSDLDWTTGNLFYFDSVEIKLKSWPNYPTPPQKDLIEWCERFLEKTTDNGFTVITLKKAKQIGLPYHDEDLIYK